MSGTTVTASTSVVLVPSSSNYTRPYIVTFPNISTTGRIITVRDNDGFVSTGNTIILSTTAAASFNGVSGPLTINQPYGFITLTSQTNGAYSVLNTFAFPAGQAAANVSNLNAQVVTIQSTLNMYDFGTASTNTIYTSSGQFIFNGDYIGQVTASQLASTVTNLGTTGYLSSIPFVYVVPPTWIAVGQSSTISEATSSGSIKFTNDGATWSNATAGKGFNKFGTAVAYGEGYYIAVGNNDDGTSNFGYNQWSFDAKNWYYSYAPALTATQMRTACLYANGLYHSVGCNNGVGGSNTILWSDDGKTWNPSAGILFDATNGTGYATGIAFGSGNGYGGVWVCSGVQNNNPAVYSLLWSSNGSNWNPAASVSFGGVGGVMDVTFDGTKFVALCKGGFVSASLNVCISFDGSNWTNTGITGADFADLPLYVTGYDGVFVATTGNTGQSLVYSLDGGYSWQSNTTLSGCNLPIYKPYYDGLKWWAGVETTDGSQSIFYTTQSAPALSNWVNSGLTGGFTSGAVARAFTSTDGQSNVTAILNSTIFGLSQTFTTCNLNASTISASKVFVGELTASTLYIGVTFVSTTYETINNISTQNVDFISAGTLQSSRNFMDSLSVNRVSVGQAFIGQLGVNISTPQYSLDVNGSVWARSTLYVGSNTSTNEIRFYGTNLDGIPAPQSTFTHTVLAERIYESGEKSEFLIFKGNDTGSGGSGPDRVRILAAGGFRVDTGSSGGFVWPEGGSPPIAPYENALFVSGTSGNVGIYTSTPSYTLDVNGITRIQGASHLWNDVNIFTTSNEISATNGLIRMTTQGGISYIQSGSNGVSTNNKLYFTGIGNADSKFTMDMVNTRMGINTSSPAYTLDVNGTLNVTSGIRIAQGSYSGYGLYANVSNAVFDFLDTAISGAFKLEFSGANLNIFKTVSNATLINNTGGNQLQLGTNNPVIYINGSANGNNYVGINTSTPTQTLDVCGNMRVSSIGINKAPRNFYALDTDGTIGAGIIDIPGTDGTVNRGRIRFFDVTPPAEDFLQIEGPGVPSCKIQITSKKITLSVPVFFNPAYGVDILGDLNVGGSLSKAAGSFEIDHPILDNFKLVHSFIEGPRCDLIYRGRKQLNDGIITVDLEKESTANGSTMTPGTFVALCINPQVYLQNNESFERVIGSVSANILTIRSENITCKDTIDWMVIAERHDKSIKLWPKTDSNGLLILEHPTVK